MSVAGATLPLDGEELEKLRHLVLTLDQRGFPTVEEMQALRSLISSDELKTLLERERTSRLWAKVRLQFYRTVGAVLGTLVAVGTAWQILDAAYRRFFQ